MFIAKPQSTLLLSNIRDPLEDISGWWISIVVIKRENGFYPELKVDFGLGKYIANNDSGKMW